MSDLITNDLPQASDVQVKDRISGIVARAVEDFYDELRCRACRIVLLDTAHIYSVRGNGDTAALLRAAADVFVARPQDVVSSRFASA